MKRKTKAVLISLLLASIAVAVSIFTIIAHHKTPKTAKNDYMFGVIYSYHDRNAVVQYYSEDGIYLFEDSIPNIRACGLCSSTGKPYMKINGMYYFVSDAAFDNSNANYILKIDPVQCTYTSIHTGMENNFTYTFTVDDRNGTVYSYYSGAPEWGCVYSSNLDGMRQDYCLFNALEGYAKYISDTEHFWPLDMVCDEEIQYYIGYIVNSVERTLCISSVTNNEFKVLATLNGYLFSNGMIFSDGDIYFSVFREGTRTCIYRYNVKDCSLDKHISLPYVSNNVDIVSHKDRLVLLDCSRSDSDAIKQILYIDSDLEILDEFVVSHDLRVYDFRKDSFVCSDGRFVYIYDLNWNEKHAFALPGIQGMKFSGLIVP